MGDINLELMLRKKTAHNRSCDREEFMERQSTIKKLFHEDGIQFAIPAYQRAYSWEYDKQIQQFIIDIKEQNPDKKYFLGHFIFEKDKSIENKYWVIDGQQRLATVIIFFSCLIHVLEEREMVSGVITNAKGELLEIWRIRENYIRIGNYKFSTKSYDDPFFINLIFKNNQTATVCNTASARRISKAKEVFEALLKSAETDDILNWKKILDNAVITTFEVSDRIQATQIFTLQNDRGKDLSALEKLKVFLMHKVYSVSEEDSPGLIENIEMQFHDIYLLSEEQSIDEDRILNYCKPLLSKIGDNGEIEKGIKDFVYTLKETFFKQYRTI
jgi:uncharacterized protein with ParB-like and HNH nuclease domain